MKYKVGDKVRIKSLDWYNANKDEDGDIPLIETTYSSYNFIKVMRGLCGKVMTISSDNSYYYDMVEDNGEYFWTDEMIEGLVEEENLIERVDDNGLPFNEWLSHKGFFYVPDGYELKDENGNVISATKIVLEKKKKEYPITYCECKNILGLWDIDDTERGYYKADLIDKLQMLLICRDAYWKIAGEEMGLGKPWGSDWTNQELLKYCISNIGGKIETSERYIVNTILAFPTEEMRDAFKEDFYPYIEICKELL